MEDRTHGADTEQRLCLDQCVLRVAVTRLAWRPRQHTRAPHVEDDRVQQEGALQPRLVPLRVHEGGVHGPVKKLLVEQDAVDVLHCGSTQKKRLFGPGHESAVLIIVLRTTSVLVTVHQKKKPKLIQTGKSFWHFPGIRGSFTGSRSFLPELEVEMKNAGL